MSTEGKDAETSPMATAKPLGMRKNGKQWHAPKKAFRPTSGLTTYSKREKERLTLAAVKAKEKEMKDEKEAERQVQLPISTPQSCASSLVTDLIPDAAEFQARRIQAIKDKRAAKEERERYEQMAAKMHKKRVERLKRREKRNKMISS
ncbi:cgr1 family protein [Zalerion maritima]|uniref:rRNA-processing protein n=1 Tax=Zalerion maritima TaxID=339359 RepID=A0AAD5WQY7_9PEZI|nr:cgr1 family protein [Zalerion maritima]